MDYEFVTDTYDAQDILYDEGEIQLGQKRRVDGRPVLNELAVIKSRPSQAPGGNEVFHAYQMFLLGLTDGDESRHVWWVVDWTNYDDAEVSVFEYYEHLTPAQVDRAMRDPVDFVSVPALSVEPQVEGEALDLEEAEDQTFLADMYEDVASANADLLEKDVAAEV